MNRTAVVLVSFLLLLISTSSISQSPLPTYNFSPKSATPEATSFQKFGEIPVGKFTGIPSVKVPITSLVVGDYSLPISLDYHSAGNKIDEIASVVGLGWTLQCGGVVSHYINGLNDFNPNGGLLYNSYRLNSTLNSVAFNFDSTGTPYPGGYEYFIAKKIAQGEIDNQPDIFSYSFPGGSGKFYYDQNWQVHTIPFNPIKVLYENERFKIINTDGVQYIFDLIDQLQSVSNCGETLTSSMHLTKILIPGKDSIVFDYETINYSYNSLSTSSRINLQPGQTSAGAYFISQNLDCFGNGELVSNNVISQRLTRVWTSRQDTVKFVYNTERVDLPGAKSLNSIEVKNGENFVTCYNLYQSYKTSTDGIGSVADRNRLQLDSVMIKPNFGKYSFEYNNLKLPSRISKAQDHYGYFNGKTLNTSLLPLDYEYGFETGANRDVDSNFNQANILTKIYYPTGGYTEFIYETNRFRYQGDVYTYSAQNIFQASQSNATVERSFTIPSGRTVLNAKIEYDAFAQSAGAICNLEVIGPTGILFTKNQQKSIVPEVLNLTPGTYTIRINVSGSFNTGYARITFQEKVSQYLDGFKLAGGLRVKKIVSRNSATDGLPIVRNFEYMDGAFSSGKISFVPVYLGAIEYTVSRPEYDPFDISNIINYTFTKHGYWKQVSSPLLPLNTISGGSVGYTMVTEHIGETSNYGKIVSKYSFGPDYGGSNIFPLIQYNSRGWKSGNLLEEITFKKVGNNFSVTNSLKNYYSYHNVADFWNYHYSTESYNPNPSTRNIGVLSQFKNMEYIIGSRIIPATFSIKSYQLFSEWVRLDSTRLEEFDANLGLSTNFKKYTYDNFYNLQVSKMKIINYVDTFDTREIWYKYPHDSIPGINNDFMIAKQNLKSENRINTVLQETKFRRGNVVSTALYNYFKWQTVGVKLKSFFSSLGENPLEENIRVESIDNRGNAMAIISNGNQRLLNLWDSSGNNLIASVKNAMLSEVAYTSFEEGANFGWVFNSINIFQGSSPAGSKMYKLNSSNPITKNDLNPAKDYMIYFWCSSASPPTISGVKNGYPKLIVSANGWYYFQSLISGVSSSVISGSLNIDELRLFPMGSEMETFTYLPGVGISSRSDNSGFITTYFYDDLKRLFFVKNWNGDILKKNCYKYFNQVEDCEIFSNDAKSMSFTPVCQQGYSAAPVSYTVPFGRYVSSISKNVADSLALNDVIVNGQAYANLFGQCTPLPVYARVEILNVVNDLGYSSGQGYLKFYSDINCTIPVSVSNLSVNYRRIRSGCTSGSTTTNYTVNVSGNSYSLGTLLLSEDDGVFICNNYTYLCVTSAGYTNRPTLIVY